MTREEPGSPQVEHVDEPRGLGRLVESAVPAEVREEHRKGEADAEVEEASEESFPGSDPPGYTDGRAEETGIDPSTRSS